RPRGGPRVVSAPEHRDHGDHGDDGDDQKGDLADPVGRSAAFPLEEGLDLEGGQGADKDRAADSAAASPQRSGEEEDAEDNRPLPEADEEGVGELADAEDDGDGGEEAPPVGDQGLFG